MLLVCVVLLCVERGVTAVVHAGMSLMPHREVTLSGSAPSPCGALGLATACRVHYAALPFCLGTVMGGAAVNASADDLFCMQLQSVSCPAA